jgi:predicted DNA-binding transcriptional regulator YafY
MLETSARLLRLLSLLQTRRDWSGPELAARLDVSTRTVRKDVERLRSLGYVVDATPGVAGGYRLGAGAAVPPLLLDDEEAVALAIGLRTAAGGAVSGIEETSLRVLAKLEQVLPSRLRPRVNALQTYTVPVQSAGPTVGGHVLSTIATACRDQVGLRFRYRDHDGTASLRAVEPHRLVCWGRRWFLVAWDTDRQAWRTFRADRIEPRTPHGARFTPRTLPADDLATYVLRGVGVALSRYRTRVTLHASAEEIAQRLPPFVGPLEAIDERTCVLTAGADTPHMLAVHLAMLDVDFHVTDPPELVAQLRTLAARYHRATQ